MDFRCCGKRIKMEYHDMADAIEGDCPKCGNHYSVYVWDKDGNTKR